MAAKKEKDADVQVTFYDVANKRSFEGKPSDVRKYSTKDTVNLCMREKKSISFELFFLLLAVFFALLVVIEFFGVYRPYVALEKAEAQLKEDQTRLEQLYQSMSDRQEVRDNYRKYNYENFPANLVNREDALVLLENTVFDKGKISRVSISGNTLVLSISDVFWEDIDLMQKEIREDKIVSNVLVSRTDLQTDGEGETATVSMTIVFKDASQGGD